MNLPSEYRSPGKYVFHSTSVANVESILENGLRCEAETASDSNEILEVLDELGCTGTFPFDRRSVVYCHIDGEYVAKTMMDSEESPFKSDNSALVIEFDEITSPVYLADMSIITDLIDYRYIGEEGMLFADSPEEVVENYRESISRVDSADDIRDYESSHAELLVDGDIPADAIVDVLCI